MMRYLLSIHSSRLHTSVCQRIDVLAGWIPQNSSAALVPQWLHNGFLWILINLFLSALAFNVSRLAAICDDMA